MFLKLFKLVKSMLVSAGKGEGDATVYYLIIRKRGGGVGQAVFCFCTCAVSIYIFIGLIFSSTNVCRMTVGCSSSPYTPGEVRFHMMDEPPLQTPPPPVTVLLKLATGSSIMLLFTDFT